MSLAPTVYRDRIRGLAKLPPERIQLSPKNFRRHGSRQLEVIRGLLGEIGVAGALLAWVPDAAARVRLLAEPFPAWLSSFAGPVRLIDGHARREELRQETPVLVTDLDETEADKLLATFDAVSDLADADASTLADLLQGVRGEKHGTIDLLSELQAFADTSIAKDERPAPAKIGESKVVEVSDLEVSFFLSARGPLGQQPEAIERLRAALAGLEGVTVELGIIGGAA